MNQLINERPRFETDRFTVVLLSPTEARKLAEFLLQDERLGARVPWLTDKSQDGALREAYGIGLQAAAGVIRVWGIIMRERQLQIGAMIVKNSLDGIDVDALVAPQYWDQDVIEEAAEPLMEWLEDNVDLYHTIPAVLH
ncbi:GNAT family N-acetyltransferase [Noviherbaspirillum aerium]|uniref:GNAT family N-acetyltransferase n=1 Tax=Noviherbaspirillum aerium TaxID=2588497 RepID=UPI00124BD970|nr:GNAT family N-acetyltransferase [Noviherbaspirillum aerium]